MVMSNDNVTRPKLDAKELSRLFKLQTSINKMVMDGTRDATYVANFLQKIISGPMQHSDVLLVDRTTPTNYPDWIDHVLYPEIESTGPGEFDVSKLERWELPDLGQTEPNGHAMHGHLFENDLLSGCLGLRDLEVIRKKGVRFFRRHFKKSRRVYAMKSIVVYRDGGLFAPCLVETDRKVEVDWDSLNTSDFWRYPVLRF